MPGATRLLLVAVLAALSIVAACGSTDDDDNGNGEGGDAASVGDLVITNVWSRPAVLLDVSDGHDGDSTAADMGDMDQEGGTRGVVYMQIANNGDVADRLVSATSDVAETLELHDVNMVEGVMQMRPVNGGVEIPAGETVVFEQGSYHVMLIGLHDSLEAGDRFSIQLMFESAGTVNIESEVRAE